MQPSVLLVDDHSLVREALRGAIDEAGEFEVVGEAGNGREGVEAHLRLRPDVTLMDIWLPELSGIDATSEIRRADKDAKVLILSMHDGACFVQDALRAGAAGYLVKSAALAELVTALRAVHGGKIYLSPEIADLVVAGMTEPGRHASRQLSNLTPRERSILQRLAEGSSAKEIAADLHTSTRTIETHRTHIMKKLGVHKTAHLVRIAIREGLLSP